eukprot:824452-Ditylum_brightwellii.AAC.1
MMNNTDKAAQTKQHGQHNMIKINDNYNNIDIDKFPSIPGCRHRKQIKINVIVLTRAGHLIM